jgi:hypothetical protein
MGYISNCKLRITLGFALLATLATWLVLGEASPFEGYFLYHVTLPNVLTQLLTIPYLVLMVLRPTFWVDQITYTLVFLQWLLVGLSLSVFACRWSRAARKGSENQGTAGKTSLVRASRFLVGLLSGEFLIAQATVLFASGFGTYVPLASTAQLLALGRGSRLVFFGAPFLWAVYFLFLPMISKPRARATVLSVTIGLHLLSGLLATVRDRGLSLGTAGDKTPLITFAVSFLLGMGLLAYFTLRGERLESVENRIKNE